MIIEFSDWQPDRANYGNPLRDARNVLPGPLGYEAFPVLDEISQFDFGDVPNEIYGTKLTDGTDLQVIGATGYVLSGTAISLSPARQTSLLATDGKWDFVTFKQAVYAVNGGTTVGVFESSLVPSDSRNFAIVPGAPSGGRCIGRCRDFLVVGSVFEGTRQPTRVRWSGFNNASEWGSNLSTQADFQDLKSQFGEVQRIIPGAVAHIFQESAIERMTYVGPPTIFRFDTVSEISGTVAPKSVVWTDNTAFYYSQHGFQSLGLSSGQITNIGANRVDDWFRENTSQFDYGNIYGAVDRSRKVVFWVFNNRNATTPSGNNIANCCIAYNWETDKWSYALFESIGVGRAELNTLNQAEAASSAVFAEAVAGTGYSYFIVPDNASDPSYLVARLVTGDIGNDSGLLYLDGARPVVESQPEPSDITVQCNYRNNALQTSGSSGNTGAVSINDIGRADFRVNARFMRFITTITGGFRRAVGLEIDPKPSNQR